MTALKHFLKILLFLILGVRPASAVELPAVLVSVPIYRYFVERIADGTLNVLSALPPGANLHTFEPTARQMEQATKVVLWFTIGESFETRMWNVLHSYNNALERVDLLQGVDLITIGGHNHCHGHEGCKDLHMWLSPKIVSQQVKLIAQSLQKHYPNQASLFALTSAKLIKELEELDSELSNKMGKRQRLIIVSHPAFAYFGRDYHVIQLSVEVEGKDATPRQLTELLVTAKRIGIKTVYVEPQYSNKGARLIASELKANVIEIDPYQGDYFVMMRSLASYFSQAPFFP